MSVVLLASGGLDSTTLAAMYTEERIDVWPLFVDYGQLAAPREWPVCQRAMERIGTKPAVRMDLSGFGAVIPSGLTDASLDVNEDAFLPARNLLLLVAAGSYAFRCGVGTIVIGLLDERRRLFPDQSLSFLHQAGGAISSALEVQTTVLAPLAGLSKRDVIGLAKGLGLPETYSCHLGGVEPCGRCVSCCETLSAGGEV